jgi:hypothetical protein
LFFFIYIEKHIQPSLPQLHTIMRTFFLSALLGLYLFSSQTAHGQQRKSDEIKYHLILDNSGSMGYIDRKQNLQVMLEEFSELKGLFRNSIGTTKPRISIDLWVYGEEIFQPFSVGAGNTPKVDDAFVNKVEEQSLVLFSELDLALKAVLKRIDSERKSPPNSDEVLKLPSNGVIIFTDGILEEGDIRNDNLDAYNSLIEGLVGQLEINYQTPVYFVVSSPQKDDRKRLRVVENKMKKVSLQNNLYLTGDRVFWINSDEKYADLPDSSEARKAFDQFRSTVNYNIAVGGRGKIKPNDEVFIALEVQKLLEIAPEYGLLPGSFPETKVKIDNRFKTNSNYWTTLYNLICLLNQPGETALAYTDIATKLNVLKKNPEALSALIKSITVKKTGVSEALKDQDSQELSRIRGKSYRLEKQIKSAEKEGKSTDKLETELSNAEEVLKKLKAKDSVITTATIKAKKQLNYSLRLAEALSPIEKFIISEENLPATQKSLESDIISGVSDYLIERVKLETIYSFFDLMKEDLEIYNIALLFPETWALLNHDSSYGDFSSIRQAFKYDLDHLLSKLATNTGKERLTSSKSLVNLYYLYHLIESLVDHGDFGKALSELGEKTVFDKKITDKSNRYYQPVLVQECIRFSAQLVSVLNEHDLTKIFVGQDTLGFQKLSKMIVALSFSRVESTEALIIEMKKDGAILQKALSDFYTQYTLIKKDIEQLQQLIADIPKSDYKQYIEYRYLNLLQILERSADLLVQSKEFFDLISIQGEEVLEPHFFKEMEKVAAFYFALKRKQYEKAILLGAPYINKFITSGRKDDSFKHENMIYPGVLAADSDVLKNLRKHKAYFQLDGKKFLEQIDGLKSYKFQVTLKNKSKKEKETQFDLAKDSLSEGFGLDKAPLSYYKKSAAFRIKKNWLKRLEKRVDKEGRVYVSELKKPRLALSNPWKNYLENGYVKTKIFGKTPLLYDVSRQESSAGKFITVAGQIANAQSSDDVKNILSRTALPVASYKIKRRTSETIMITAYPGVGYSHYRNKREDGEDHGHSAINAPVGIEYSLRLTSEKRSSSLSLMATFFDFGNVIDYRTSDESKSEFEFENILSPGLILSWGFSDKIPLSLNAGYLFNRQRTMISLNFDMPLFNLWSRQ